MTNLRDRFQNGGSKNLDVKKENSRILIPKKEADYTSEAESLRFVKAYYKQKSRYIPEIDYKDPGTFAFFGSAEKYYEDSINNIYSAYPYDGSKAEKMEWSLSASYLDLYLLEHEYPKEVGSINIARTTVTGGTGSPSSGANENPYFTVQTPKFIKFFGGPQKNTIYDSLKNRESNIKIDGTTGNTVEFWLKKDNNSWLGQHTREVILDINSSNAATNSPNFGRMTVEIKSPSVSGKSPFYFTYRSGSTGTGNTGTNRGVNLGDTTITKDSVADGKWHHYAITAITSGTNTVYKFYVDGTLNHTVSQSHVIGPVNTFLSGTIGASTSNGASATMGRGQLSASLDEVRIWKTARTEKEIGRFWYSPVHGGTDNDHTNADLGIYYKFNEGILGTQEADKVVLDYSGRINNGEIVNWDSSLRSLDSAITLSEAVPEENYVEHGDPIINPENTKITALETELKQRGRSHDVSNLASLRNSVPQHFTDTDTGEFLDLLQIMSSTFDDLFIKIKQLPKMKDFSYQEFFAEKGSYRQSQNNQFLVGCEDISLKEFTGHHAKPWVSNILEHFGIVSSDIFQDATLFERFFNRTEEVSFEHDLEEVKRLVLSNIHKNLIHILKTKGTEDSFRNLIRCFGVDDEIIKLNAYGDNEEYELITKPIYTTVKQKALSFKGQNFQGNIYNALSGSDTDAASFITGSSTSSPLTMEGNFIFPKYDINSSVAMSNASLFGMHSIADDARTNASLTFRSTDDASLQVRAVKNAYNEPSAYFELTSSEGIINSISSSYIPDVYENQHWNISVRVGAKEGIDFNIQTPSEYFIEFTGYNYDLDVLKNSFQVSASISAAAYNKISQQNKAIFVGSHRTNFSGSLLESTDVKVLGFNAWRDVLTEEELKEHAQNPKVFGRKKPQSISNFDSGANLLSLDSLIFRWQFEAHTSSSAGGELEILDMSSGSLANGIGHKYNGKAQGLVNQSEAISQEFLPGVEYFGPDNAYSSDRVKIKSTELEKFQADSKPVTYNFAFEKSMYQVISREMVNFFAGIVGFSNIIGEPVNKYRRKYKLLEKIRNRFFLRVGNEPDIEKFIEYYKWIDSSLSKFLGQLIPASSFLDSEIKDVVESHILERNKYEHKAPTVEFKDPSDRIYSILGVNELLYDWEHGHPQTVFDQLVNEKAIKFAANGDAVSIPDADIFSIGDGSTDSAFSFSAWVYIGDVTADSGVFASKRDSVAGTAEYFFGHTLGNIQLFIYDNNTVNRLKYLSTSKLSSATWHHIAITYDGSGNHSGINVYVDGSLFGGSKGTEGTYVASHNTATEVYIGATKNPTSNTFEDFIADVVFYNKALTAPEVAEVRNGGKVKDMTTFSAYSSIISWYKMGDDLDNTGTAGIKDYVSTHHGTLVGSAEIVPATSLNSDTETVTRGWDESRPQDQNCLWLKERSEVSADREAIKKIAYTEVNGSTYATRRLVKPYRLSGDNVVTNKAGFNRDANKNTELYKVINTGKNITLKGSDLGLDPECRDNINPNKKKMYKGKTDVTGTAGYLDGDSDLILPFNLVSSSAGTDLPGLKDNVRIANNHLDFDITGEKSLRGPFGETHIGGMPHNKVRFGTAISERPEAYFLNVNTSTKTLTVDPTPINAPKSMYFRGVSGTRFANVSNIRHDTSSLVLGNYNKDYEIVMTNGRATNNDHFVDNEGSWVGVFTLPQDGGLTDIVNYSVPDRGRTDHVVVNRFSAPGSPESQGSFSMDSESEEFSVYNTMNYRNLLVRDTLNKLHAERSNQFGLRKGSATQASLHMTNRNFTRLTGALGQEVEPDSFFVQRPIPAHDFSYSWITASANEDVYSFLNKNENYGHQHTMGRVSGSMKSSQTISFLGSSQLVPNLDFVHGNFYATASLNTTTNTVTYADTALNSQILNVQGPYGWPTWKQIRGYEHPISRYERLNAKISLVVGKTPFRRPRLFPETIQVYKWSTNPSLQNIDFNGTATVEKTVQVFDEIMATNRFNPLTITFHGAQARDLTTRSISQTLLEHYWNNDETSLVALGSSAGILSGLPALQTRLASLKISAANEESTFANYDLTERLGMQDIRLPETVSDILRELGNLSTEEEDIYATEINYIETLYPREVNTFTKESRIREKFDFHAWRDTRALRQIMLTGSIVNHVGSTTNLGVLANQAGASFKFDGSNDFIEIADNDILSPVTSSITNVAVRSFTGDNSRAEVNDHDDFTFIAPVETSIAASSFINSTSAEYFQVADNNALTFATSTDSALSVKSFLKGTDTRITTDTDDGSLVFVGGPITRAQKSTAFDGSNDHAKLSSHEKLSFVKLVSSSDLKVADFEHNATSNESQSNCLFKVEDTDDLSLVAAESTSAAITYRHFKGFSTATNRGTLYADPQSSTSNRSKAFSMIDQSSSGECDYSIMFWIKPDCDDISSYGSDADFGKKCIITKMTGDASANSLASSEFNYEWLVYQHDRHLVLITQCGITGNAVRYKAENILDNATGQNTADWQHIVITYDQPLDADEFAEQELTITKPSFAGTPDFFRVQQKVCSTNGVRFKLDASTSSHSLGPGVFGIARTFNVGIQGVTSDTETNKQLIASRIKACFDTHKTSSERFSISRSGKVLTFKFTDRGPVAGEVGDTNTADDSGGNLVFTDVAADGVNTNNSFTIGTLDDGNFSEVKFYKNGTLFSTPNLENAAGTSSQYRYVRMVANTGTGADKGLRVGGGPIDHGTSAASNPGWMRQNTWKGFLSNLILFKHDGREITSQSGTVYAHNTRVLTAQQVKNLYNNGFVFDYSTCQTYRYMVAWYKLDGNTFNTDTQNISNNLVENFSNDSQVSIIPSGATDSKKIFQKNKEHKSFVTSMWLRAGGALTFDNDSLGENPATILSKKDEWILYQHGRKLALRIYDSTLYNSSVDDPNFVDFNVTNFFTRGETGWIHIAVQVYQKTTSGNPIEAKFYKDGSLVGTSNWGSSGSSQVTVKGDGLPSRRSGNERFQFRIGAIDGTVLVDASNNSPTRETWSAPHMHLSNVLFFVNDNKTDQWANGEIHRLYNISAIPTGITDHVSDYRKHPKFTKLQNWWKLDQNKGVTSNDQIGSLNAVPSSTSANQPLALTQTALVSSAYQDQSFSISAWVLWDGSTTGTLIAKNDRSSQSPGDMPRREWELRVRTFGFLTLDLFDHNPLSPIISTNAVITKEFTQTGSSPLNTGWNHVVVVYRAGSDQVDFYVNYTGTNKNTKSPEINKSHDEMGSYGSMTRTDRLVHIGARQAGGSIEQPLAFSIHNLVIWDKDSAQAELTDAQVTSLRNGGNAWELKQHETYNNMLIYYKMNSSSPTDIKSNTTMSLINGPALRAATTSPVLNSSQDEDRSFTIALYFKKELKDTTHADIQILGKWRGTGENNDSEYLLAQRNRKIVLKLIDTSGQNNQATTNTFESSSTFLSDDINRWEHIAVTYDQSSSQAKFYRNGVLVGSAVTGNNDSKYFEMQDTDTDFTLGAGYSSTTADDQIGADISNLVIFKAAAGQAPLTDNQVAELYNGGLVYNYGRHSKAQDMVLWWKLNESTGANITDHSGKGNTGKDVGTADVSLVSSGTGLEGPLNQRVDSDQPFTVSFWAKPSESSSNNAIISKSATFDGTHAPLEQLGEWAVFQGSSLSVVFQLYDLLGPNGIPIKKQYISTANILSTTAWKFITIVYDPSATDKVKLYHGTHENSTLTAVNLSTSSDNYVAMRNTDYVTRIGNSAQAPGSNPTAFAGPGFKGLLSNMAIYSGALNNTQVTGIFNGGYPHDLRELTTYSNAVAYWKLEHTSDGDAIDLKNSLNGTRVGVAQKSSETSGLKKKEDEDIPFSFAFWIKRPENLTCFPLSKMQNINTLREYNISLDIKMMLSLNDTSGLNSGANSGPNNFVVDNVYSDSDNNNWVHYVATYDPSSTTFKVYKNGSLVNFDDTGNQANYSEMQNTDSKFLIGGSSGTASSADINGSMSHVIVFKNHALTLSEAAELYNEGFTYDYSTHSQYDKAVAWWKLDETSNASGVTFADSKNNHDAVANAATTSPIAASSSGLQNRAFVTTPITITAWIKPERTTGAQVLAIRYGGSNANQKDYSFFLNGQKLRFDIYDKDTTTSMFSTGDVITEANKWYHVAVTYTPNTGQTDGGDAKFYIDGTEHIDTSGGNTAFDHPIVNAATPLRIGGNPGHFGGQHYKGNVAKVLMWIHNPSVAPLTSTQIQTIANLGFCYNDASIPRLGEALGYWKLDEFDLIGTSTQVINYASGSLPGSNSGPVKDTSSSPDTFSLFYKTEQANKFDYRSSNGHGVDFADVSSASSVGASPNFITASRWPLDARTNFNLTPLDLVTSSFNNPGPDCFIYTATSQGSRGEGVFQNDYSIFGAGANFQHGTPPVAPVYSRRVPQYYSGSAGSPNEGVHEFLAGEAEWLAAEQLGSNPFSTDFEKHAENYRQVGQDHSLVPEFIISDHVEDVILNSAGEFNELTSREAFLSVTGAVYHTSSQELQVSEKFYKTYGISDMMKYFGVTLDHVEANDLGDPLKLTLRCKAALKFTPYRGFYPVERVQQITELFTRGYMPEFDFVKVSSKTRPAFVVDEEVLLKAKVRANLQQSIKPLFAPGVLMNSIKSGMAVDYPLFSADNIAVKSVSGSASEGYQKLEISESAEVQIGPNSISYNGDFLAIGNHKDNSNRGIVKIYKKNVDNSTGRSDYVFVKDVNILAQDASDTGFGFSTSMTDYHLAVGCQEALGMITGDPFTVSPSSDKIGTIYIYSVTVRGQHSGLSSVPDIIIRNPDDPRLNCAGAENASAGAACTIGTANNIKTSMNFGQNIKIYDEYLFTTAIITPHDQIGDEGILYAWKAGHRLNNADAAGYLGLTGEDVFQRIQNPDHAVDDSFGTSFDFAPVTRTLVVSSLGTDGNGPHSGAVYVYEPDNSSGQFAQKQKINVPPGFIEANTTYFGQSISISDDGQTLAIGQRSDQHPDRTLSDCGVVHVYKKESGNFVLDQTIYNPVFNEILTDGSANPTYHNFGYHVKIRGLYMLIEAKTAFGFAPTSQNISISYLYYKNQSNNTWTLISPVASDLMSVLKQPSSLSLYVKGNLSDDKVFTGAYELTSGDNKKKTIIISDLLADAVDNYDSIKRQVSSPSTTFSPELKLINNFAGSIVNGTADTGKPRLSGSVYKRVTFEEMLNPDSLKGLTIEDQEPHPSASIYYADKYSGKVMDFPFKFGELDAINNEIDIGVASFSLKKSFDTTMKPYRLAINNFCAETVNFFLKDGKVSSLETRGVVAPKLFANEIYKMRVEVVNSGLRMYDRHSAFGPPVHEGDYTLLFNGTSTKFTNQHAYSPFVPPFLDTDSSPYVDISFTPTESREHTLEEIIDGAQYSYVNFSATPDNASENTNYINAMSLSASLKLDGFVIYESDNPDQGTTLNQRTRWVIQPRWETPILNFVDATVSSLRLDTNQVETRSSRSGLPWQQRGWKNFYTSYPGRSGFPYLTSSTGMWHQAGTIPKSEGEGYTLRITPHPDVTRPRNQLADRVGFTNQNSISTQVGQLRDRKVVYESVIAIPFLEPDEENGTITYFDLDKSSLDAAAELNANVHEATVARLGALVSNSEEYIAAEQEAERLYNTPGQGPTEATAYILRMQEKFVIPEEFRNKMMYVFQYSAEFTKQDLANIWQNVAPTSDFSGKELRYSTVDPTQGISGVSQDVQYISNFLNELSPTEVPMNFKKDKIRWIVIKAKQRAEFDLNIVKRNSLRGTDLGLTVDDSRGTFNATPELENARYSFNWPYDFFSIVELVKLEGKVDIFDGVAPIVDQSGEDE